MAASEAQGKIVAVTSLSYRGQNLPATSRVGCKLTFFLRGKALGECGAARWAYSPWGHKPLQPLCEDTDVLCILSCFYRCSAGGLVPYGSQTLGYMYIQWYFITEQVVGAYSKNFNELELERKFGAEIVEVSL